MAIILCDTILRKLSKSVNLLKYKSSTNLDNRPQRIRNPKEWLRPQHPRQPLTPHQPAMPFRNLSDRRSTNQTRANIPNHVFHVPPLLHEPKAPVERHRGNHIKRVPLEPLAEIDFLPLEVLHRRDEDVDSVFGKRLHGLDCRHGELLGDWPAEGLVLWRGADGEHAWHEGVLVGDVEDSVEEGLPCLLAWDADFRRIRG